VADDDAEMRAMLAITLRHAGYEVIEVADGRELVHYFSACILHTNRVPKPDVVISDIRMPGPNGLEILRGLRASNWAAPMILITAFGDDESKAEARRLGAVAFFDKPFDLDDLRDCVLATAPPSHPPAAA
jgi:DNA-binding response OmpR family regulator